MLFNTLSYIAKKFNDENLTWAVGASVLLNQYSLVKSPNDIDILVALKDVEKADSILKSIGNKNISEKSSTYLTKYFYEYNINGIDIDLMSGLTINFENENYEYLFNKDCIKNYSTINDTKIPLTSLEDWYILYQLIPNRDKKVSLIENYLIENNIKIYLSEIPLSREIPSKIKLKSKEILVKID